MRIALDAMGTDRAPGPEVAGALAALHEIDADVEVILVGDEETLRAEIESQGQHPPNLRVVHAPDRVVPSDPPASVLRRKPNSSIAVGLRLQADGMADAFVSAGSTGAVMAASLFTLRPLPGIDRPPVGAVLPTAGNPCLLLDAGANVDCKPQHLVDFARLGHTYAQEMMGCASPRIGLLNIGEEPEKGNELTTETFRLLEREPGIQFVGNIEGRDIIHARCDVVVCDGFVGNVLLKFYESVAGFIVRRLREELGGLAAESERIEGVFRVLDYTEYGGAPLLGVGGVSIICHGGSPPRAIQNALKVAVRAVRSDMVGQSARNISMRAEPRGGDA